MIGVTPLASIVVWGVWIAAVTYFTEPLADRLAPLVFEWWDLEWGDGWHVSFCIAACLVAVVAGLVAVGAWWVFMAVVM